MRRVAVAALGLVILVFFAGLVREKERLRSEGELMLVPLLPGDPRSLMQGDYMVLRYDVPVRLERAAAQRGERRGLLVVQRDSVGRVSFLRLHERGEELASRERLLAYVWRRDRVDVGAPSFFFEEARAETFQAARFGELRVDTDGSSVLVGLRDAGLNRLGRAAPSDPSGEPEPAER